MGLTPRNFVVIPGGNLLLRLLSILWKLPLAIALSAAVVAAAAGALYVTSAPAVVSYLCEPFSILLLPGTLLSIALEPSHDFTPRVVLWASLAFYTVCVFRWLYGPLWPSRQPHAAARASG